MPQHATDQAEDREEHDHAEEKKGQSWMKTKEGSVRGACESALDGTHRECCRLECCELVLPKCVEVERALELQETARRLWQVAPKSRAHFESLIRVCWLPQTFSPRLHAQCSCTHTVQLHGLSRY